MRVNIFRYVCPNKRTVLPAGGGEKTRQIGLDDVSIEQTEKEFVEFCSKHNVAVATNIESIAAVPGQRRKTLTPELHKKQDFLSEFKEWLVGEQVKGNRPMDDQQYDIYVLYYTGSGTEDGDFQLQLPNLNAGFAQHSSTRHRQSKPGGPQSSCVSLMDIVQTWDEFKKEHFKGVMTYEQYRKLYFTNRLRQNAGLRKGGISQDHELNSSNLAVMNPVLWIISDVDYSNTWVEQALAKNLRDVVIQGTCDESGPPLNVFAKAWLHLQNGKLDSRQFAAILKNFGGANCNAKEYSIPGLKFPAWSRPKFKDLQEGIKHNGFSTKDDLASKIKKIAKKGGNQKHDDTSMSPFKQDLMNLCPMQIVASRKQHLGSRFSSLQIEMEETVEELEAIRLLYVDADTRPGKENLNNPSGIADMNNTYSLDNLMYIIHSLKIYIYNPNVCLKALKCLWALTYDEEVRNELVVPSVIQIIVKIIDIHIADSGICLYATGVISRVAWNMNIWRSSPKVFAAVWSMLIEFCVIHPGEEELIRLIGVGLSALAVEKGPGVFSSVFPVLCDLVEYYSDSLTTVYSLLGTVLQIIQIRIPDEQEDCLRVFALFMQTLETHTTDANIHRQCALGMLKLSTSQRAKDIFSNTPVIVNLWISLVNQAMENFMRSDPYIIWLFISIILNLLRSHGSAIKNLLFIHPKARSIYKNATIFVAASGDVGDTEVLKQVVKEFIEIFQNERQLMRQLIINEKKKEKL